MKILAIFSIVTLLALSVVGQTTSTGATQKSSPASSIGMFAYPRNQQNSDQQLKDETDCYSSARQQTGI